MSNRKFNPLVLIIMALGAIGLVTMLIRDPLEILRMVAIAAVVIGIFVFVFRRFASRRDGGAGSSYQHAVKQSTKKYKKQQKQRQTKRPSHLKVIKSRPFQGKKPIEEPVEKRKNEHGLTVIDGKKRKKKNRAFF